MVGREFYKTKLRADAHHSTNQTQRKRRRDHKRGGAGSEKKQEAHSRRKGKAGELFLSNL